MNPVAQTPPMGWNSWDCYETRVTERDLHENARVAADKLASFGYRYVVCDIQWSAPPTPPETRGYRPFVPLKLDAYGRQQPDEARFPSSAGGAGFSAIARRIHDMGLRFGIHIMRGVPRQAAHARDERGACLALFNLSDEPRAVSADVPERCAAEVWGSAGARDRRERRAFAPARMCAARGGAGALTADPTQRSF